MNKIWAALTVCTVLLTGCNVHKIPGGTAENTPAPTNILPRMDVAGNIITTVYAEGEFVKAEGGVLFMTENGEEKRFRLSARAEKDIEALGITEGTEIIVNYNRVDEGQEAEAISLEKLL